MGDGRVWKECEGDWRWNILVVEKEEEETVEAQEKVEVEEEDFEEKLRKSRRMW